MTEGKITPKEGSVDFWLDLKSSIENLLQFANPEKHLEILDLIFDAYIQSEFADMASERREVHVQYGIFREILKTLQKHSICSPIEFNAASA